MDENNKFLDLRLLVSVQHCTLRNGVKIMSLGTNDVLKRVSHPKFANTLIATKA
jgi:hypothetical protein